MLFHNCYNCGKILYFGFFHQFLKQFKEQGLYLCRECRSEERKYESRFDDIDIHDEDWQKCLLQYF